MGKAAHDDLRFERGDARSHVSSVRPDLGFSAGRPGVHRTLTTFPTILPRGNFILGGLVRDRNSRNSPSLDVSIANWVLVSAR